MRNPSKPRMNCAGQSWILWDDIENLIITVKFNVYEIPFWTQINADYQDFLDIKN